MRRKILPASITARRWRYGVLNRSRPGWRERSAELRKMGTRTVMIFDGIESRTLQQGVDQSRGGARRRLGPARSLPT